VLLADAKNTAQAFKPISLVCLRSEAGLMEASPASRPSPANAPEIDQWLNS
jgi:hypothetical protein